MLTLVVPGGGEVEARGARTTSTRIRFARKMPVNAEPIEVLASVAHVELLAREERNPHMQKIIARILLSTLVSAPLAASVACDESHTTDANTGKLVANNAPDAPPPFVMPPYTAVGDGAALKQQGAAGIDDKNASSKAAELEGALDAQIKDLAAKKRAQPT